MINQIKCLHKNYKKDDKGKWELTGKKTESVDQKYYNQIVSNLDLERDTWRTYGCQPFGNIKKAVFYGFDRQFKTTYEFMENN